MEVLSRFFKDWNKSFQLTPLTAFTLFFALGMILARFAPQCFFFLSGVVSLFLILALFGEKRGCFFGKSLGLRSAVFLWLGVFFLGCCYGNVSEEARKLAKDHLASHIGLPLKFQGEIISEPVEISGESRFIFRIKKVIGSAGSCSSKGNILVRVPLRKKFFLGDHLLLEGALRRWIEQREDSFFLSWGKRRQISAVLNVRRGAWRVMPQPPGLVYSVRAQILTIRRKAWERIEKFIDPALSPFAQSMLLGARGALVRPLRAMMLRAGTWHLLVVSGAHTTLVGGLVLFALKLSGLRAPLRYLVAAPFLVFYCFLCGGAISVVRATIMSVACFTGYFFRQRPLPFHVMSLSVLWIVVFDATALFDIGFWLSFLSVWGVIFLSAQIHIFLRQRCLKSTRWLGPALSVSLGAWLATLPLIAFFFHRFSWIGVISNIVAVPLAMLILAAGFVFLFAGALIPGSENILSGSLEFLLLIFFRINEFFASPSWAECSLKFFPFFWVFIFYGLTGSLIFLLRLANNRFDASD